MATILPDRARLSRPAAAKRPNPLSSTPPGVRSTTVKRLLVASAALALVGGLAPWNGSAGAVVPRGDVPDDRVDVMVKQPGEHRWTGKGVYDSSTKKRLVLHRVGSKAVVLVRFVNTGTETTSFDYHTGHPYPGFDDSETVWPNGISQLEPGQAVTIRYVTRRTREAQPGDTSDTYFSIPFGDGGLDYVKLLYRVAR
jgi:hypothetical protein